MIETSAARHHRRPRQALLAAAFRVLRLGFEAAYARIPQKLAAGAATSLLVGHRGVFGHPSVLENTLAAFDLAINHGAAIELDLRATSDGVVVVHHDASLLRVHGIAQRIDSLTFEQLRSMAPLVPTLAEVLARYGERCAHYYLEVKEYAPAGRIHSVLASTDSALTESRLAERATIIALDSRPLDAARQVCPTLPKAHIFLVNPLGAAAYVERVGDTGLMGWYLTFPLHLRPFLRGRQLPEAVGFINHLNTWNRCRNRHFPVLFTDRVDRLMPHSRAAR